MLIPFAGFVLFLAYKFIRDSLKSGGGQAPPPVQANVIPSPKKTGDAAVARGISKHRGDIVLILDDVGFDHQPVASAMRIDPNLNFSVLPNAARAHEVAEELHRNGFEVLCHLPMEPLDYPKNSPGPHAVMISMSSDEIAELTREDIAAVPHAVGVNNHMGSRATLDPRVMTSVLSAMPKGMYFIDSMTVGGSVAGKIARQMKIPTASRQVFLDDVQSEKAVRQQLDQLATDAEQRGVAVGIGHMYDVTVRVLNDQIPSLRSRGFRLLRASEVVE